MSGINCQSDCVHSLIHTCGLSISQQLCCPQPSELCLDGNLAIKLSQTFSLFSHSMLFLGTKKMWNSFMLPTTSSSLETEKYVVKTFRFELKVMQQYHV